MPGPRLQACLAQAATQDLCAVKPSELPEGVRQHVIRDRSLVESAQSGNRFPRCRRASPAGTTTRGGALRAQERGLSAGGTRAWPSRPTGATPW